LDSRTSITIDDRTFSIEADDLESLCVLGRGAYGVVEKVKHKQTGTILAVKVKLVRKRDPEACIIKLITAVTSFMIQAPAHKPFLSVIYGFP
jgi:hypothetical protein